VPSTRQDDIVTDDKAALLSFGPMRLSFVGFFLRRRHGLHRTETSYYQNRLSTMNGKIIALFYMFCSLCLVWGPAGTSSGLSVAGNSAAASRISVQKGAGMSQQIHNLYPPGHTLLFSEKKHVTIMSRI